MHSMPLRREGWPRLAWTYLRTPRFSPLRLTRDNRSVLAFNLSFLATRTDLLRRGMEQLLAWADAGAISAPHHARSFSAAGRGEGGRSAHSGPTLIAVRWPIGHARYSFDTVMEFELDPNESGKNHQKHGIDFVAAQALWEDPDRIEIPAATEDEPRAVVIGKIENQHGSAIVIARGEKIRITSVRRSRPKEIAVYEG